VGAAHSAMCATPSPATHPLPAAASRWSTT
jgi:hypothetical protein